jgi:hypothetical protein
LSVQHYLKSLDFWRSGLYLFFRVTSAFSTSRFAQASAQRAVSLKQQRIQMWHR